MENVKKYVPSMHGLQEGAIKKMDSALFGVKIGTATLSTVMSGAAAVYGSLCLKCAIDNHKIVCASFKALKENGKEIINTVNADISDIKKLSDEVHKKAIKAFCSGCDEFGKYEKALGERGSHGQICLASGVAAVIFFYCGYKIFEHVFTQLVQEKALKQEKAKTVQKV